MAFTPVRLTHPGEKLDDVVAETAIDYNNFVYRDGYVKAKDEGNDVKPAAKLESAGAKSGAVTGKATDAKGNTVQTS